jgi:hypothetical protein
MILWVANWIAVKAGWSPFLYCWGLAVGPWLAGWYQMITLVLLVGVGLSALAKRWTTAFYLSLIWTAVTGIPKFWATVVGLGGVCL